MTVRFYKDLPDEIYLALTATMDEDDRRYWLEDEPYIRIDGYVIIEDGSKLVGIPLGAEVALQVYETFYFILTFDSGCQRWAVVTEDNLYHIDISEETLRSVMEGKGVPA